MKPTLPLYTAFAANHTVHPGILSSRSIDSTLLNNFRWMAEYTAASYCNKDAAVGSIITCEESGCLDVTSNQATVVATLSSDDWKATGGVVILDSVNKAIVISFTGTDSVSDYILDLDIIPTDIDLCDGCQVHNGFLTAWNAMSAKVTTTVKSLISTYGLTWSVTFTGHSLGAAVATVAAAHWRVEVGGCELYTFGSPRVGNLAFATFVSEQAGDEYRVTHLDDPVPRLPGHDFGYYHTNMEYWLSTGSATTTGYTASDVQVCEGYYNTDCNSAGIISTDFTAHSYYFEHISACA